MLGSLTGCLAVFSVACCSFLTSFFVCWSSIFALLQWTGTGPGLWVSLTKVSMLGFQFSEDNDSLSHYDYNRPSADGSSAKQWGAERRQQKSRLNANGDGSSAKQWEAERPQQKSRLNANGNGSSAKQWEAERPQQKSRLNANEDESSAG